MYFPPEVQSTREGGSGKAAGSHAGAGREGVTRWYLDQHWDAAVCWSDVPWGRCGEGICRKGGWQIYAGGPILLGDFLQVRR